MGNYFLCSPIYSGPRSRNGAAWNQARALSTWSLPRSTKIRHLFFTLGREEYGMEILKMQEMRS